VPHQHDLNFDSPQLNQNSWKRHPKEICAQELGMLNCALTGEMMAGVTQYIRSLLDA
jgi:hypothetical protein